MLHVLTGISGSEGHMAGPQEFTCRACGAQFDSRDKLDKHNKREHSVSQADGAGDADRTRPNEQTSKGQTP
jgi:hypothetical protein